MSPHLIYLNLVLEAEDELPGPPPPALSRLHTFMVTKDPLMGGFGREPAPPWLSGYVFHQDIVTWVGHAHVKA